MKYLRPIPVTDMKNGIIILVTDEEIQKDAATGIEYPHQISYIKFAERKNNRAQFTAGIPEVTEQMRHLQKTFLDLKNKCIRNAELLNDSLRNFLLYYYSKNKLAKDRLIEKDFMGLRDVLSEIIKTDKIFWQTEQLLTYEERKNFRRVFTAFIEDRNIYTHGHLHIRTDLKPLIKYLNKVYKTDEYCTITIEIIQSYFDTCKSLSNVLAAMKKVLDKKQ